MSTPSLSHPDSNPQSHDRVAIIGAGPAGLATARALKQQGIPFTVFEQHDDVGGIWNRAHTRSPMYRSAHFISSRRMSGHMGFPMPEHYPDYPSNQQILAYIQDFARHYDLLPHIRFKRRIEQVQASRNGGWELTYSHAHDAIKQEHFRWVVCANGTNWTPNRPPLPNEEAFTGEIIHSVDYSDESQLRDKRVLVVGAGNSGVDIACDAAFAARQALISLRRGYHFVPKHIFGIPADEFGEQSRWLPGPVRQRLFGILLRLLVGDLQRLGLPKPDHPVMSSHPILNSQILHYLQHGDLTARGNITHLEGNTVTFKDGQQDDIDLIILATGYHWDIPYLPPHLFRWRDRRPQTYLKIFNPEHPSLFLNGFIETDGGAYKLFDDMGHMIAMSIRTQRDHPSAAQKMLRLWQTQEPDLSGAIHYVDSPRHTGYTNSRTFVKAMKKFRKQMHWPEARYENGA